MPISSPWPAVFEAAGYGFYLKSERKEKLMIKRSIPDNSAALSVAEQILLQLGGRKFVAMTGSSHFLADEDSLSMRLIRNQSGANRLRITLRWDDLYDMSFFYYRLPQYRVRNGKVVEAPELHREIKTYEGVFCDQLRELFTEVTGLKTQMPHIILKTC